MRQRTLISEVITRKFRPEPVHGFRSPPTFRALTCPDGEHDLEPIAVDLGLPTMEDVAISCGATVEIDRVPVTTDMRCRRCGADARIVVEHSGFTIRRR